MRYVINVRPLREYEREVPEAEATQARPSVPPVKSR